MLARSTGLQSGIYITGEADALSVHFKPPDVLLIEQTSVDVYVYIFQC